MFPKSNIFKILTKYRVASTPWLTRSAINIKISVAIRTPLPQDPRSCVQDVHKVRVRGVQISRRILTHIKDDGWV